MTGRALANGLLLGAACWMALFMLARVAWVLGGWPAVAGGAIGLAGLGAVILSWPAPQPAGRSDQ